MILIEEAADVYYVDALHYIVGETNVDFYKPGAGSKEIARLVVSIPVADIVSINGSPLPS